MGTCVLSNKFTFSDRKTYVPCEFITKFLNLNIFVLVTNKLTIIYNLESRILYSFCLISETDF